MYKRFILFLLIISLVYMSCAPDKSNNVQEECLNSCDTKGEMRCSGSIVQTCKQTDICVQWVEEVNCHDFNRECYMNPDNGVAQCISTQGNNSNNNTNNNTNNTNNTNNNNTNNNSNLCDGIDCSGHGTCQIQDNKPSCQCNSGFTQAGPDGLECVPSQGTNSCDGITCSGHGTCKEWPQENEAVCICDEGYTPSGPHGLDCVPTTMVCISGPLSPAYDSDNDGQTETTFTPSNEECEMYELLNRTRASHDPEGHPECHRPLMWDIQWAAHGRNHSIKMKDQGGLFHEDYPYGQNCAYGCGPECEMDMYMNGSNEPHCPDLSHHCNIMRCSFGHVGIGYAPPASSGYWNTQNFY